VYELVSNGASMTSIKPDSAKPITTDGIISITPKPIANSDIIEVEESLSLQDKEKDLILRALKKYKGKRKRAAQELGISERTLYRKINEYRIDE
jgi:transcriptional regulator with PAS, ATPase and Fis domain